MKQCVRKCAWDEDMTHCTGCRMSREALQNWYKLSDDEKETALKEAQERLKGS